MVIPTVESRVPRSYLELTNLILQSQTVITCVDLLRHIPIMIFLILNLNQCYQFTHSNSFIISVFKQIIEADVIANQNAIDAWNQRDVTCRNILLATTEPNQKQNLYGLQTAKMMWDAIAAQYAANADDLETQYVQSLYDFKFDIGITRFFIMYLIIMI